MTEGENNVIRGVDFSAEQDRLEAERKKAILEKAEKLLETLSEQVDPISLKRFMDTYDATPIIEIENMIENAKPTTYQVQPAQFLALAIIYINYNKN
ncbi:hypothetical protein H6775_03885 [Candidatus Nomurabacteria bacterium]|nr:hypothetical protein [Candidatus Nomurabacteria bacterium]